MSLPESRAGHVGGKIINKPVLTDEEFLCKSLAAVRRRRGLIHGKLTENGKRGMFCAIGALCMSEGGEVNVPRELGNLLQEFNDSMPRVSRALRRARVIQWLESKIQELPK